MVLYKTITMQDLLEKLQKANNVIDDLENSILPN